MGESPDDIAVNGKAAVCAYCGQEALTGDEPEEHPIPAAIGSGFTVDCVCAVCNEWANLHIDQPILTDDWMRVHRADFDIRDHRRPNPRRVPHPFRHGVTDEGVRVTADENWVPSLGSKIVDNGDGTMRVIAGSMEEAERLLDRARRQAEASGHRLEVNDITQGESRPRINASITTNTGLWLRATSKMALGIASGIFPREWRSTEPAERLRADMRDDSPVDDNGAPTGLLPKTVDESFGVFRDLLRPPEHLAMFRRHEGGGSALFLFLFGKLFVAVPVDDGRFPVPDAILLMDPQRPKEYRRTNLLTLIQERVLSSATAAGEDDETTNA